MKIFVLLFAAALTTACGSREEQRQATETANSVPPAIGDLEDPPFNSGETATAIATPPPAPANAEAALLPPGVQTRRGGAIAPGETALSITTPSAPARLIAWYRSPERRGAFVIGSELEEGAEHVLSGTLASADAGARGDFTVRIAPAPGGGSTAMLLVTGRR